MIPIHDEHYQKEQSQRIAHGLLRRAIRWQIFIVFALCIAQCAQLVWIRSQCRSIYGLSKSGQVFATQSFSCPTPGVEPLYDTTYHFAQVGTQHS